MRSWKDRWSDRPALLRGRLHGRTLKLIGGFIVLAVAAAVWQFAAALGGGDDSDSIGGSLSEPLLSAAPGGFSTSPEPEDIPTSASAEPSETASESASPSEDPSEAESTATAPVSEEPEEPPESEAPGPGCTAALRLDKEWSNSITVTVEVSNTGPESFDGWEVVLAIEDVEITSTWGMNHRGGDRYGNGWLNGDLEPGQSAEPSFRARAGGDYALPETVPCSPA